MTTFMPHINFINLEDCTAMFSSGLVKIQIKQLADHQSLHHAEEPFNRSGSALTDKCSNVNKASCSRKKAATGSHGASSMQLHWCCRHLAMLILDKQTN